MAKLCTVVGLLLIVSLASATKLVCHMTNWAQYRPGLARFTAAQVDPYLCTHVIYALAIINVFNQVTPTEWNDAEQYTTLNRMKTINPDLKTLLSVGDKQSVFPSMIQSPASRAAFINSAISYLRSHNFDGLNLDWHLPGAFYRDQFTSLVQELDQAFINEAKDTRKTQLLLSANVPGLMTRILSYDVPGIAAHLDFINVVTFDFHGHWESITGHNSPLYPSSMDTGSLLYHNVNASIVFWLSQGAPAQKLLMGFPAFARTFRLSSPNNGLGAPANGAGDAGPYTQTPGFWSYYEVCLFLPSATVVWIDEQKVPYATHGWNWAGYDDKRSFCAKVELMRHYNLGGGHVWTMDFDDFGGHFCSEGPYPLIRHLRKCMGLPDPLTTTPAPTTTRDPILDFCKGRPDGLYPNMADKTTYFQCFQGNTYLHRCQPGLIYWENCQCCNWP